MGLSAWKQYQSSRWALRVNPSSGNLHPTECYVVWGGRVCHYAPAEHALEVRCDNWNALPLEQDTFLVGLTSILWREAWKYGERAFRYCQHDVGHAIAALRCAAALLGWKLTLLPRWSDASIGTLLGVDRDADFVGAEREEPECVALVTRSELSDPAASDPQTILVAARAGEWHGKANRLSADHVAWPIIDEVAAATRYAGGEKGAGLIFRDAPPKNEPGSFSSPAARAIILRRRSAIAFDSRSALPADTFVRMLRRLDAVAPPWDALPWPPQVHLTLFVHRVEGLTPGLYAYLRDDVLDQWRAAMRPEFLWEQVRLKPDTTDDRLFLLLPMDVKRAGARVSCDQDIAGDGFFSLGMIARFAPALAEHGDWFYRRLFWECGVIGQVLYLEAEAAGARSTGIGCFYDDAVHEVLGLSGADWQSLYHFSMGAPVDDTRLTTQPGYDGGW